MKSWVGIVLFLTHAALAWLVILKLLSPEVETESGWVGIAFCMIILGLIDLAWYWSKRNEDLTTERKLRWQAEQRGKLPPLSLSPDSGKSINA